MKLSKHNIISRITNSDDYFIVNLLSGNADILSKDKAKEIFDRQYSDVDEYVSKGYLVDEAEEDRLYRKKYADFIDGRDSDEIQIFFVPWYSCNFECDYCYQDGYGQGHTIPDDALIDSFFAYIENEFAGRKKYLTMFGGEPLLAGTVYEAVVRRFLDKAKAASLETAIVTNGYNLAKYVDTLKEYRIREIQVTLDGTNAIHDRRRPLKGGGATFARISSGIDRALDAGLPVNLRVVVDRENIASLPSLARYAIDKGWTRNPGFKTQLGRNYELHTCQTDRDRLLTRVEMYREIYTLIQEYPDFLEFHKPAFSISKFLFENGELPAPLFDSCPGTKTEWAFDATGRIYSCTATVGKTAEALGTYYPSVSKRTDVIEAWGERDITTIKECTGCTLRLACGGGCASVAFNKTGRLGAPDCRPVKELLEMGISVYFNKERTVA